MREPTEMELRVAAVIEPAAFGDYDESRLPGYYANLKYDALLSARAAIRAMREPTKDMCDEGATELCCFDRGGDSGSEYAMNTWKAMIDTASPPGSGAG